MEGIRPSTEDGQVRYDVRAGTSSRRSSKPAELFEARNAPAVRLDLQGRRLYKMSLGDRNNREEDRMYPRLSGERLCRLGFGEGIDFTGCDTLQEVRRRYQGQREEAQDTDYASTAVHYLKNEMELGDLVLVSDGNFRFRAIGEVTGPYQFQAREAGYEHCRPVRWRWSTSAESSPVDSVHSKRLSQMTIYLLDQQAVKWPAIQELLSPSAQEAKRPIACS